MQANAHGALGSSLLWSGELTAAREHFERVTNPAGTVDQNLLINAGDYEQMAATLSFYAWTLAILGFLDQATSVADQVISWARGQSRPVPLMLALTYIGLLDQFRGDVAAAEEEGNAGARSIAAEYQHPHFQSIAVIIDCWVQGRSGEVASGIVKMRSGIANAEATGLRRWNLERDRNQLLSAGSPAIRITGRK
jgi:hypothetical protein